MGTTSDGPKRWLNCASCGARFVITTEAEGGVCPHCHYPIRRKVRATVEGTGREVAHVTRAILGSNESRRITVSVSGGQVGALNLGTVVGNIESNLNQIDTNDKDLAEALKKLTEVVLKSGQLSSDEKKQITEQVEELSHQAAIPQAERKIGIVAGLSNAVAMALSHLSDFDKIWPVAKGLLETYFRIKL